MMLTNVNKRYIMLMILTVVILVTTPLSAIALTGAMGEPGANCPNSDTTNFQYVTPPYTGTFTAEWIAGTVYISGLVDQVGQSICSGNVPAVPFGEPMTLDEFQNLHPDSIRGACLVGYEDFFPCVGTGFLEVVGVGNLRYNTTGTTFTSDVIIMPLQER